MSRIDRRSYASMFGPTTGDRVRLADTALIIEVERDFTVYGDEVKFGGGKVIRDGMGQSQVGSTACVDPVASSSFPNSYSAPRSSRTRLASMSSAVTVRSRSSSTPRSTLFRQIFSRGCPFQSPFESEGRVYGRSDSWPIIPIEPSGSRSRIPATAAADVIPPPISR